MKKSVLVVAGMVAGVVLVIFGAAELTQTQAEPMEFWMPECQEACYVQYMMDLADCYQAESGRESSLCRREARAASRACLEGCLGS